jgi:RNA polymerase sigma factor (sigma-70 family)
VKVELLDGMLSSERNEDVLAVDAALQDLAKLNEQYSKVVECRFFGGLNWEETAEALGVSVSTVRRQWRVCNAWLRERLEA